MADRTRMKIENIIPGVEVVTYNQATESFEIGKVIDIQTPKNNNIINILTDDITINCTTSHPFWSVNKNDWASYDPALTEEHHAMKVLHLEEGDILLDENGEQVKINTINIDNKSRKITTYNLTVEGNSNYFANGILVHNKLASNFQNAI
jgi:intein/homing endonuclease